MCNSQLRKSLKKESKLNQNWTWGLACERANQHFGVPIGTWQVSIGTTLRPGPEMLLYQLLENNIQAKTQ